MSKFGDLINIQIPILLNFYSVWNEDCQSMNPVLKDVAAAMGDQAKVIKIDVDKNQELSEALRIKSLPTIVLYKNGEMVWRKAGIMDANTLVAKLKLLA